MSNNEFWKNKLRGFLHDPPEKAFILFRRAHEKGTVQSIYEQLGFDGIPATVRDADRRSSGADRLDLPPELWQTREDFLKNPVIKHPLSMQDFDLVNLENEAGKLDALEDESTRFLTSMIVRDDNDTIDYQKTLLKFWRFAPRPWDSGIDNQLGRLISILPADTRMPDHTIWDHLNLTATLSGILGTGQKPALLRFTIGPVQPFIASARKTADLWAGSHLLSTIIFEAIRVVIDEFGPDSILFPSLLGVPAVDLWLSEKLGLKDVYSVFSKKTNLWLSRNSDANPLWIAALPNLFTAIVPEAEAKELAKQAELAVRALFEARARAAVCSMFDKDDFESLDKVMQDQVNDQLKSALEVFWSVESWDKAGKYHEVVDNIGSTVASIKNLRDFEALQQEGYRCSVCGEREWLTDDRDLLAAHDRRVGGPWEDVWKTPSKGKEGERLCAICTLKRMWPELMKQDLNQRLKIIKADITLENYIVSTHTMALAPTLEKLIDKDVSSVKDSVMGFDRTALPYFIIKKAKQSAKNFDLISRLPDALDEEKISERDVKNITGYWPEKYYAVIQMDGDHMGAWFSGGDRKSTGDSLHPDFLNKLTSEQRSKIGSNKNRLVTPAYHGVLSAILNDFSSVVGPRVVENVFKGKLIYAGGDDLLAFMSVDDVLDAMLGLRFAFSGLRPPKRLDGMLQRSNLRLSNGFARVHDSLYRLMGAGATLSMGVVIAHFSTPLSLVLRRAGAAESEAKNHGRNAFVIKVLKRSGGEEAFKGFWGLDENYDQSNPPDLPLLVMSDLRRLMAPTDPARPKTRCLSRNFVYHLDKVLPFLKLAGPDAVKNALIYQMKQQRSSADDLPDNKIEVLAARIVEIQKEQDQTRLPKRVLDMLKVVEFLSRGGRQ